ncbi:asparagine synthetase B family protein [Novosphingobium sp. P6W]|uniref:asparagine synthase-related protein n=1 Tax=Novosphingobium sp. P6W TaxID=1609758 RepID=UPI0005C2C568|nr:asparagine synthetase B family protein [Novosphingobium sp. P6W]AXB75889.1 asparagine synthetase B family protein [Novosphingobium sp. P6W]KIS32913.1 asparagine synthase [Novosphingobium sp. P6W]
MTLASYFGVVALEKDRPAPARMASPAIAAEMGLAPCVSSTTYVLFAAGPAETVSGMPAATHVVGPAFARPADGQPFVAKHDRNAAPAGFLEAIEARWGAFVAWTANEATGEVFVYRDPSARCACYYTRWGGELVIASHLDFIEALSGRANAINWAVIADELLYPDLVGRSSAILGIEEVLPGEIVRVGREGVHHHALWTPAKFIDERRVPSFEQAEHDVARAVERSCRDWSALIGPVALTLSGGLDSSVLAATLPALRHCITLVSGTGSGDERAFAAEVCRHLDLRPHQRSLSPSDVTLRLSSAERRPRPSTRAFTQSIVKHAGAVAREFGACAIAYGSGGDNVFCFLRSATPASDRLEAEGFGAGYRRTVMDVAAVTECSPLLIARRSLQKHLRRRRAWTWPRDERLLARGLLEARTSHLGHPWLDEFAALPVGKREHIAAIMRGLALVDYLDGEDGVPVIYPLLSQPVLEACLRQPTWLWYRDGVNRAIVRRAYAGKLPTGIVQRASKGGFTGLVRSLYLDNLAQIRSMLLDGELCARGIVNRQALEANLGKVPDAQDHMYVRIMRFVDVEAWLSARRG